MADLTFVDLQNEVLSFRFSEGRRASCKRWLNSRYSQVWSAAEWPFKRMDRYALAVTAGSNQPTMPSDFRRAINLYDERGQVLEYQDQAYFNELYGPVYSTSGRITAYTVVNGQIYLGYVPGSSVTYRLDYQRRLTAMTADSDTSLIPAEHRYMLVAGAMATGLKEENDPTYRGLEDEFNTLLAAMMEDLLPADQGETWQFGRDMLGMDQGFLWQG